MDGPTLLNNLSNGESQNGTLGWLFIDQVEQFELGTAR